MLAHLRRITRTGVLDEAAREFVHKQLAKPDLFEQTQGVLLLEELVRKDPAQLEMALRLWHTRFEAAKTANDPVALIAEVRLYQRARQETIAVAALDECAVAELNECATESVEEWLESRVLKVTPELDTRRFVAAMEAASAHIRRIGDTGTLDEDAQRFVAAQLAEPGLAAQHLGALVLHRLVEADPAQLDTALDLWRARARADETMLEPLAIGVELTLYRSWHKASFAPPSAEAGRG
jgi:hypothetical protein